ncbi:IS91 family transposase [Gracilibacillus salinarum]|uniref:Transposase n=1 Tax=Gracilibacillus salinarum TaxID=2932255 RepID=A0ABY4GQI7_9BACI|nr:transposase [Gracilibacillus salinarum]UOQ86668.1 transposase [Gracilibacillus salinarum]
METNILKEMLFDDHQHWETFKETYGDRIRPVVIKEVEKFRDCGDMKKGFKLFVCEGCHETKHVPYRCKGRFCTTCAVGESEEWSRLLSEDVYQVNHRHVILTIDEDLRDIFLLHRELLKPLMDEGVRLIREFFEEKSKVTPGIIAGLHTFGSTLNFNPHVHMLVTMGGITKRGAWKVYDYIPYTRLRKQWQTVVLKMIRAYLSPKEKKKVQGRLQKAYRANGDGFYVYAPKNRGNVTEQLRYIGRYMRRPAIGLNRIVAYDGDFVTFTYMDKKTGEEETETMMVEEFIKCLIRHIPDEQFKVIRHYGIYSRRSKSICRKLIEKWQERVNRILLKVKKTLRRQTWRERVIASGGKDPMVCRHCDNYYEYMGEVCLDNEQLDIKVAINQEAQAYLERMIRYLTSTEKPKKEKTEETKRKRSFTAIQKPTSRQLSLFDLS